MTPADFRAALKAARLTQREFAERSGVARSTVSRWATGVIPAIPQWVAWVFDLMRASPAE
jgi:transcriptional regulator with XRE-family HTH domain